MKSKIRISEQKAKKFLGFFEREYLLYKHYLTSLLAQKSRRSDHRNKREFR